MKVLLPFSTSVNLTKADDLQIYCEILYSLGKLLNGCSADVFRKNHCIQHQVQVFLLAGFLVVWVFPKLLSVSCSAAVVGCGEEHRSGLPLEDRPACFCRTESARWERSFHVCVSYREGLGGRLE